MYDRALLSRVRERLAIFPCVALLGLRQVGKSTLAAMLAEEMGEAADLLDLRNQAHLQKLADPAAYLARQAGRLVIIDEIQSAPAILDELRGQVELRARQGFSAGHFLLLGSDCVALRQSTAERLGGHLATLELGPLQPQEIRESRGEAQVDRLAVAEVSAVAGADPRVNETRLWLRGGMPRSYDAATDVESFAWRRAFTNSAIARGFQIDGHTVPVAACTHAWLVAAMNHGHDNPVQEIMGALGCARNDAIRFIQQGCDMGYFRQLPQWHDNDKKRLRSRPKLYMRDTGLLHAILNLNDEPALADHDVAGRSWEGHALEAIIAGSADDVEHGYFKSVDEKAELDIVVARGNRVWAFEVKKSTNPTLTAEFYRAVEELQPERMIVIYRGSERYGRGQAEIMSLRDAVREISAF